MEDLQLWALFGEPCLCRFAALVGSYGPFLGSRVYANLQLWSAVMGLVWVTSGLQVAAVSPYEPCLGSRVYGFAALVGSSMQADAVAVVGGGPGNKFANLLASLLSR